MGEKGGGASGEGPGNAADSERVSEFRLATRIINERPHDRVAAWPRDRTTVGARDTPAAQWT